MNKSRKTELTRKMRVLIVSNYEEMSGTAARIVLELLDRKRDSVFGLATGGTPVGLYNALADMHVSGGVDFSGIRTFNLDEYYGLDARHPQSYRRFMEERFFSAVNIKKENTFLPDGKVKSEEVAGHCKKYEDLIKQSGGIDLQVLGIGGNGHIGFNEPGSSFSSRTRLVALKRETVRANSRFFPSEKEVPVLALSMGIGTILEAAELLLLVSGTAKADILAKALEGPLTSSVPASALQMHPKLTVVADEDAAASLCRRDFYDFAASLEKQSGMKLF